MIPARFEPVAFVFVLSGLMSFLVSGISTVRATGLVEAFPSLWFSAWLTSWIVAFPVALVVVPVARRMVQRLIA